MEEVTSRASICEVRERLRASDLLTAQTAKRFDEVGARFEAFLGRGFGIETIDDVTLAHVEAFVRAKANDTDPATATMHMRRTVLRLLFRTARNELGLVGDPTLDLALPPRSVLSSRPLTDDEVALGRSYSLYTTSVTRQPAAWALCEATATTAELSHIRVDDLDLDNTRVWLHGSTKRIERWGYLNDWGVTQLQRRAKSLRGTRHLVYQGNGSEESRMASCSEAIKDTLARAGLDSEPDVRPPSVAAWAGRCILNETKSIEEVTRRLGFRSLDGAASFIGHDWQS